MDKLGLPTSGPWKFDRRGNHDSFKNHLSFMKDKNLITLVTLTPKQVYEECDSKNNEKGSEQKKKSEKESEQKKKSEKESEQKKSVKKRVKEKKIRK